MSDTDPTDTTAQAASPNSTTDQPTLAVQAFEAWNDGDVSKGYDDRLRGFQAGFAAARTIHEPRPAGDLREAEGRFWLIVREPGMVPERKGSWPHRDTAKVLREFIAARPRAFLDVLTIGSDGTPDVQHGPEALQMADARSMSTGSKHNARVRAAAEEALATHSPAPMAGEDDDATLLADANSWYSIGQIEEMEDRARDLRSEVRRCNQMIESGKADPWWREDRDRFQQELRSLEDTLAAHPSTQEGSK